MKILILNQAFYPDVVATAQHATDLAVALSAVGHQVTVVCSRRGYDNPATEFPSQETWRGIRILRIWSTRFGKNARWRRATDFATFIITCCLRVLSLPRFDVIVALTSPPLISFVAALAVPLKARRLVFWSMDLNPDEAIAAGWLRETSMTGKLLSWISRYSMRKADVVVVLDRFMKERILAKGIEEAKITIIPPWSLDDHVHFDATGRNEFRACYGLEKKFVVMYSGNHSPCHPLDTLIGAAERLSQNEEIAFCFVGGGSEFQRVKGYVQTRRMRNVVCIPYQPIESLSASLSAADLHVIVMGNDFVGIVHPCKIYNILAVGKPFLYVGPPTSHVTDIMGLHPGSHLGYSARHADIAAIVASIMAARANPQGAQPFEITRHFSKKFLLPKLIQTIEGTRSGSF